MTRPSILIAECARFSTEAADLLAEAGDVRLADLDRSGLLVAVHSADVLWVRLRHRIDSEVFSCAPHLRAIATPTTGLNHIDLDAAAERGIEVVSLRGETGFLMHIHATAEHTIALMLALLRHLPAAVAHAAAGGWDRDLFQGGELHGRTVGIVGYGRVGRMAAHLAEAFGARVLATDAPGNGGLPTLDEVLATADIVTLHVDLSPHTAGFFGAREFARMRPGALFVNTARGELVDEAALLRALQTGRIGAAALDVVSCEAQPRMPDHPIVQYARCNSNLLLTPHIGGCTRESMASTEAFLARRVAAFLRTGRLSSTGQAGDGRFFSRPATAGN